ncbi:hypothetical protein C9I43_10115 [Shewanella morhuae]|uniref:Uncharacterized protein n=1 Tax=Shewanella morhuae TaxID=365591 RepID=A0ABX5HXQ6_9GAMM|nr:hypothetical protein C9I43_10115 [Shewanella morhuae]
MGSESLIFTKFKEGLSTPLICNNYLASGKETGILKRFEIRRIADTATNVPKKHSLSLKHLVFHYRDQHSITGPLLYSNDEK